MRRRFLRVAALAAPLVAVAASGPVGAQGRGGGGGVPHEWLFGSWTGGVYPAVDTEGAGCLGQPVVIFTRDVVLRASPLDIAYRQRAIETVSATPDGVAFRLVPAAPPGGPFAGRLPPDIGFGCPGGPDLLPVERRGPDEIAFPGCEQFPSPLKRCTTGR